MTKTPWSKLATKHIHSLTKNMCSDHKPMSHKTGYSGWHEWSEKKIKQGHIQKQCDRCGRWFFKCEY